MSEQKETYYDCYKDAEEYSFTDPYDAIEDYLKNCDPENWEQTTTAYAYVPEEISERYAKSLALRVKETIFECLDGDFGHPEEASEVPDVISELAFELAQKAISSYRVWRCKAIPSSNVSVPTAEFVREECVDWLEDIAVREALERLDAEKELERS